MLGVRRLVATGQPGWASFRPCVRSLYRPSQGDSNSSHRLRVWSSQCRMATQGNGKSVAASASTQRNEDYRLEQCVKRLKRNVSDCTQVSNKLAAVLVPLFEDESGVVKVILTKRTSKMNSHSGEVCLPGGKRDEGDKDDAATALREANEEIGLLSSEAEVISELDPMLSKHGLSVKPVVAVVKHDFVPIPSAEEVSSVFSMPLHFFLEGGENHSHRDADWGGLAYRLHFFQHDDYTVRALAGPKPH